MGSSTSRGSRLLANNGNSVSSCWSLFAVVTSIPAQVRTELTDPQIIAHPDVPGAWAARAWKLIRPRPSPDDGTVQQILRSHPELVRVDAERGQADPYVAALALEQSQSGRAVTVVTKDEALRAACTALGVGVVTWEDFVTAMRA